MKHLKKTLLTIFLFISPSLTYSETSFVALVYKNEYSFSVKLDIETIYTEWLNVNGLYNCEDWTPEANTQDYGIDFQQTRNCEQDQTRNVYVYQNWSIGDKTLVSETIENQTIIISENQTNVGTKDYITHTSNSGWTNYYDYGSPTCSKWTPEQSGVVSQTQDCTQTTKRTITYYDHYFSGTVEINRIEEEFSSRSYTNYRDAYCTEYPGWPTSSYGCSELATVP
jgi:hypothetical protein